MTNNHDDHSNDNHSHHHILPTKVAIGIGCALLCLTMFTVWIAGIDLGKLNFVVAMLVATVKALLVALFFMNLYYDHKENGIIFGTAFVFLAIFMVFTSMDLFFRGDVYVKGPIVAEVKSKLSKPWISTPALVARGKELFAVNCVSCHGTEGYGDGPAAAAINPHPRNFHQDKDWVNGRKPTDVFKTLKTGVPGSMMASFATLPSDDRWALDAYVLSLGPKPPVSTTADLASVGIDPTKDSATEVAEVTIPVESAMHMMAMPSSPQKGSVIESASADTADQSPGEMIYNQSCVSCHGAHGQGGQKVSSLPGISTPAYILTDSFKGNSEALASQASFTHFLDEGIPGGVMPSYGQLSGSEIGELYKYVKGLHN
jgi:caa(3)-type oxidase subunit IV